MLTKLTVLGPTINFAVVVMLSACAPRHQPPYSIRDFPDSLQPALNRAVSVGYFEPRDSDIAYFDTHFSDSEISLLSRAEIPLLRAIALRQMSVRPGFNMPDIIMTHLDDTAIVPYGHDRSRLRFASEVDYMIDNAEWKTASGRDSLADVLILHHNNLQAAYAALRFTPPLPKYYEPIKTMATRKRVFRFDTEVALAALAKYRKKEDIPLIAAILWRNERDLSVISFQLMLDYPDMAYLRVLTSYYPYCFHSGVCRDHPSYAADYINTLAAYRTDTCAKILSDIITTNPLSECTPDSVYLVWQARYAVWNHPCAAYKTLLRKVGPEIREEERLDSLRFARADTFDLPAIKVDSVTLDTTRGPVRWRDP